MSNYSFNIKQNDTSPTLSVVIADSTGTAINLTGGSVQFKMRAVNSSTLKVNASATITNASNGAVSYTFSSSNTDTSYAKSDHTTPSLAEECRLKGKQYYEVQNYIGALDYFTKAIEYGPTGWDGLGSTLSNRSATYFMLGRYPESIDDCVEAMSVDPALHKVEGRRGRAHLRMGDFDDAE